MESLNERIKNLRKEKGWTQLQLAEKLNVTDKAVSKWEVGEANPDLGLVVSIATLFGVTIDYLLTGKVEEDSISLDDMDSAKRMHYLIKKDDATSFVKYGYKSYIMADKERVSLYYGDCELTNINQKVWSEIINENANNILDVAFDYFIESNNGNACLAILVQDILPIFIKKAVELDRGDVLEKLGLKTFILVEQSNVVNKLYKTYLLPIFSNNDSNNVFQTQTFFISQETLDYIFEHAKQSPKCFNYISKVEIESTVSIGDGMMRYYCYNPLENSIIKTAIKYNHYDIVEDYYSAFNDELIRINDAKYNNYNNSYRKNGSYFTDKYRINGRLFDWSKDIVDEIIANNKVDLAIKMINHNKLLVEVYKNIFYQSTMDKSKIAYVISESEVMRNAQLSRTDMKPEDKLYLECVNNSIVIKDKLSQIDDIKFAKKILDENYGHPMEFVYDALINHKERDLYKYLIDTDMPGIAAKLLINEVSDPHHRILIEEAWNDYNCYSDFGFENPEGLIAKICGKEYVPFRDNSKLKEKLYELLLDLGDNKVYAYIKENKYSILDVIQSRLDAIKKIEDEKLEKAKIVKGLTKDYFENLLKENGIELFVIKLCSLLDAILKFDYKYEGEDFFARLNVHFENGPKSRYCDDGWGYSVIDVKYEDEVVKPWQTKRDLFNRLRIQRNNIAHSESNPVKELSLDELRQCLDYVFSINKEEK